jgi:hypothetical protein
MHVFGQKHAEHESTDLPEASVAFSAAFAENICSTEWSTRLL